MVQSQSVTEYTSQTVCQLLTLWQAAKYHSLLKTLSKLIVEVDYVHQLISEITIYTGDNWAIIIK